MFHLSPPALSLTTTNKTLLPPVSFIDATGHLSCVRLHGIVAMQYKQVGPARPVFFMRLPKLHALPSITMFFFLFLLLFVLHFFAQSSYNIPMAVFVSSGYIKRPPIVFVLETSAVSGDMHAVLFLLMLAITVALPQFSFCRFIVNCNHVPVA